MLNDVVEDTVLDLGGEVLFLSMTFYTMCTCQLTRKAKMDKSGLFHIVGVEINHLGMFKEGSNKKKNLTLHFRMIEIRFES